MYRFAPHRSRRLTPRGALGLTILLAACSGCMPSKYSNRELEDASKFVKARLEATFRSPNSPGKLVRWVQGPQAVAGSDTVAVFGELEAIAKDGTRHTFICNAALRRRENHWSVVRMKVQDQTAATTPPVDRPVQ